MNGRAVWVGAIVVLAGLVVAWAFGLFERAAPATQIREVRVQFGWIPDAHHAGFYVASAKGYYQDEGLDVKLLPGGLGTNAIKQVVSGAAEIGQAGGLEQFLSARAEGLPVVGFAAIHRETPHALISLARAPIRSPGDLAGKRIAVAYGDAAEILFKAFVKKSNVAPNSYTELPFRFDLTPLINGDVDAVTGFRTDQPATLQARGQSPVTLAYEANGISSYGYTFFVTEIYLAEKADIVDAFERASRRGWQYAFDHPDEALALLKDALGSSFEVPVEQRKLSLIRGIMLNQDGRLAEWSIYKDRFSKVSEYMIEQGQLKSPPEFSKSVRPTP